MKRWFNRLDKLVVLISQQTGILKNLGFLPIETLTMMIEQRPKVHMMQHKAHLKSTFDITFYKGPQFLLKFTITDQETELIDLTTTFN